MTDTLRSFSSYSVALREALFVHEALRRLGFSSEDIYVHRNDDSTFLVCYAPGGADPRFAACVGKVPSDWRDEWAALVEAFNARAIPEADLQAGWDASLVRRDVVGFVMTLAAKGAVPEGEDGRTLRALAEDLERLDWAKS